MESYLYQTIHTLAGQPRLLAQHVALLDRASQALFGQPYCPNLRDLEQRISALLTAGRLPRDHSVFVRLELSDQGQERLSEVGVSLYTGYALRSLQPQAITIPYELPWEEYPTSVSEAATTLSTALSAQAGARCSIRCNALGELRALDAMPLFALQGTTVYTPTCCHSVERELAIQTIHRAGLEVVEHAITERQLPLFDELFGVDHRGITALSHCNGQPYMSLIAERLAKMLNDNF